MNSNEREEMPARVWVDSSLGIVGYVNKPPPPESDFKHEYIRAGLAATRMREACVEKVKVMRDEWQQRVDELDEDSPVENVLFSRVYAADKIAAALESLTLDQVEER